MIDDIERDIRFDVTVIESLTERKQNTSSILTLYKYKYKMDLIKTSDNFKPGLKYTAFVSRTRFFLALIEPSWAEWWTSHSLRSPVFQKTVPNGFHPFYFWSKCLAIGNGHQRETSTQRPVPFCFSIEP